MLDRFSIAFSTSSQDFPYGEDEEEYQEECDGDQNGNRYDDKDMHCIHK